ncbi:MAG: ThuA domain-containing protein [Verrucomicrobia bacterium]|nr:ThuA domain-containing protein [Verrucomicrobiota bacterium]
MKTLLFKFLSLSLLISFTTFAADPVRVLVWDEQQPKQSLGYGDKFLGETIAAHLATRPGLTVKATKIDAPDQGLPDATLDATDVLVFWSHVRQKDQNDERVEAVVKRVIEGKLSLIALHSAHWSKPFVRLMQERAKADAAAQHPSAKWEFTNDKPYGVIRPKVARITPFIEQGEGDVLKLTLPQCVFPTYRADGAPSHVTTLLPDHPIAKGLPAQWDIPQTEMYGEPFHVPTPDEIVFEERWDKGEHFRSACVWKVGKGRVFYFRPGHETFPVFKQAEPLLVIENAIRWLGTSDDGFTPLFNGKDLTGWDGDPKLWKVENGIAIGTNESPEAMANNSFLIWRGGTVKDFELRATVRVIGDNNSGIQYRSRELKDVAPWVITGYQCDIHPAIEHTGMTYEERGRGIFGLNGKDVMLDPEGALWQVSRRGTASSTSSTASPPPSSSTTTPTNARWRACSPSSSTKATPTASRSKTSASRSCPSLRSSPSSLRNCPPARRRSKNPAPAAHKARDRWCR